MPTAGAGAFTDAGTAATLAAFISAADGALTGGTGKYYFADIGTDGYLAFDADGNGITTIVQLIGAINMVASDII